MLVLVLEATDHSYLNCGLDCTVTVTSESYSRSWFFYKQRNAENLEEPV